MQGTVLFSGEFLGGVVAASAWGPQPAETLVSEEVWRTLGALLHESNDVHFSLCEEDPMQQLSIVGNDKGDVYLMSRLVAVPCDIPACRLAMLEARQLLNTAVAASIRNPARNGQDGTVPEVRIEIAALHGRCFEILMYESIRVARREGHTHREKCVEFPGPGPENRQLPNPREATLTAAS